jgi:Pretoxin HINT domain
MQGKLETTPIEEPPAVEQPAAEQPALEQPAEQAPLDEPAPKQPETAKPKTPVKEAEPTQKPQPDKPSEAPKQPEEEVSGKEESPNESPKKDPELERKHSEVQKEVEDLKNKRDAAVDQEKRLKAQLEKADLDATKAQKELGIQKARGNFKGAKAAQERLDAANARKAALRGKISKASADARDWERLHANKARELEVLDLRLNPQERTALPCFSADTVVWGATGPTPICSLVPGDMVRALDLASKTVVLRPVDAVFVNRTVHFYDIRLDGEVIRATARHRFWLPDEYEWVEAKDLKVGAQLLHWDGLCKEVEEIVYYDVPETPTYNLRVNELPNYFVGPGVLVHNDGAAPYKFGKMNIYEGTNREFPGKIYVGQTDDLERREGEHQEEAAKELERTDLTKEQRDFWEFKKGMKLRERITGLNEDQANYMEQKNINIELKVNKKNLVNRKLVEVSKERMDELELKISKDPIVKEAGFCAK